MIADRTVGDWDAPDFDFRFDSGRLCLNVVATVGDRSGLACDRWRSPEDLGRWCVEAGYLSRAPKVTCNALEEGRRLREAIHRMVQAVYRGGPPDPDDLARVNAWAARPALAPQLAVNGREKHWIAAEPLAAVLASVARDAIDLLSGDLVGRIRECAEESCSILFVDASRPGKRRWCSMNRCGNRVKKQAFRRRLKAESMTG